MSIQLQRTYYEETAANYERMHGDDPDQMFALRLMLACIDQHEFESVLDVGSGTGRVIHFFKQHRPNLHLIGVEPSEALRRVAYANSIKTNELLDGDGTALRFDDESFDLVCEFGVLHHVPRPDLVVAEMLRVARRAIFISDSNNFGQGSPAFRILKQMVNALGLWPIADWFKTKGKGYISTDGDGISFSYSVFNNLRQIEAAGYSVSLFSTRPNVGENLYRSAPHVALLGMKQARSIPTD